MPRPEGTLKAVSITSVGAPSGRDQRLTAGPIAAGSRSYGIAAKLNRFFEIASRGNGTYLKRNDAWERLPGAIVERIAARCRSHGSSRSSHRSYGRRLSQCHCFLGSLRKSPARLLAPQASSDSRASMASSFSRSGISGNSLIILTRQSTGADPGQPSVESSLSTSRLTRTSCGNPWVRTPK